MKIEKALSLAAAAVWQCGGVVDGITENEADEAAAILNALAEVWPSLPVLPDGDPIEQRVWVQAKRTEFARELKRFYSDAEVEAWFTSPHPLLHRARPIDLIEYGRHEEVKAVIDQLRSGAYA